MTSPGNAASILNEATGLLHTSSDYDLFLAFLRNHDFSKIESIKALVNTKGMPLAEAKQIVHSSRAWQNRFAEDEQFHASLAEAINDLAAPKM